MKAHVITALKGLLPDPAVRLIRQKLARRAIRRRSIDLRKVSLIREASLRDLGDAQYLERELLPRLGLNDELLHEFPRALYPHVGTGLLHWQYPSQFSRYLVELARHRIETYLEIGARHGGTFVITVEYLSRFHPVSRAVAVDLECSPALIHYANSRRGVAAIAANSQTDHFREFVHSRGPFDLVLIDGDHSEAGCRHDFETVAGHARIIVLHDIASDAVPGVGRVWKEIRATYGGRYRFLEFTEQYREFAEKDRSYLGIGMAISEAGPK